MLLTQWLGHFRALGESLLLHVWLRCRSARLLRAVQPLFSQRSWFWAKAGQPLLLFNLYVELTRRLPRLVTALLMTPLGPSAGVPLLEL